MSQATSSNSVKIYETKVVDKIGYSRAVYTDNGSHFKGKFDDHLKEKGVKHYFAPITHPSSVGLAERYVRLILNILRAVLQHHPEWIFEWDLLLPSVIRAANTRYIKMFGFSPAELLLGFNPRYAKGADEFEDVLRSQAIGETIDELMTKDSMTLEEAAYESRMAAMDEVRQRSLTKRYEMGEKLAEGTEKHPADDKVIKKGSLVILRRTQQDNQHSHKLEPRWEGPYKVQRLTEHGQAAWISELHSGNVKGKYHLNALTTHLEGKEVGRTEAEWRTVAQINAQVQNDVKKHMSNRAKERKAAMNAKGQDSTDYREPDLDIADPKYQRQFMGFPEGYGDELHFKFWKNKAINLYDLMASPNVQPQAPREGMSRDMSLGSVLNPS